MMKNNLPSAMSLLINYKYGSLLVGILFLATNIHAQFYISAGGGYAYKCAAAKNFNVSYTTQSYSNGYGSQTTLMPAFSFGKGINLIVSGIYYFTENIGCELMGEFLYSEPVKGTDKRQDVEVSLTYRAMMAELMPSLVLKTDSSKVRVYSRTGLVLGYGAIRNIYEEKGTGYLIKSEWKYSGGVPVGFSASLGLEYKKSRKISLFAEAAITSLSYGPRKGKRIYLKREGKYPNRNDAQNTEIIFVDNSTTSYSSTVSNNQRMRPSYPFSSIGLNVGIIYTLGKNDKE